MLAPQVTDDGTATFNLTPSMGGDGMTFNLTPVLQVRYLTAHCTVVSSKALNCDYQCLNNLSVCFI